VRKKQKDKKKKKVLAAREYLPYMKFSARRFLTIGIQSK